MAEPARARGTGHLTTTDRRPASDPATGWRYWQLRPDGLLRSVTHRRVTWAPGRALVARCLIGGHDAPAPGCACGIHAEPSLDALRRQGLCMAPAEPLVVGQVSLWGDVVTDGHGLRAGLAYPASLALVWTAREPDPDALAALAAYCGSVSTMAPGDALGDVAAAVLDFQAMSR
ncbi:MAG TPA: hypothetical protein VHM89_04475 [Acidimicrobiales bacterium]|nr:hypothetical protein [Acidimicrobiales bacterium]